MENKKQVMCPSDYLQQKLQERPSKEEWIEINKEAKKLGEHIRGETTELITFTGCLRSIGVDLTLTFNTPFVYLTYVNNTPITKDHHRDEHAFIIGSFNASGEFSMTDKSEIFGVISKALKGC